MKKTLTVNISGVVFHIDEDAYNVLHDYLQSIKKHFAKTEGADEIISDIEARIAEMLKDRIGNDRQVITIEDIEVVIKTIGTPEEFGEMFEEDTSSKQSSFSGKATKRLYRDPENTILSGVCGGLGAYFHADPVWFRLAFVVLSIIGFGTPLLVYIILWVVVPEAKTAAERLEMRGEPVNVSNIEKSIKEEISNLKDKFNEFTKEAKRTYKKKSAAHRSDIQQVESAMQQILQVFLRIVLIFTGVVLAFVALSLVIIFLVMFFGFGYDVFVIDSEVAFISLQRLADLFLGSVGNSVLFQISLLLVIGLPILMLLYGGVKLIFGLKNTRYVGITSFNIWIVSLIITVIFGYKVFRDFGNKGVVEKSEKIELAPNNTLNISASTDKNFNHIQRFGEYVEIDDSNIILTSDEEDLFYGIPKLEFERNHNSQATLQIFYHARGRNKFAAEERALNTLYSFELEEGVLRLDPFFKLSENETWRSQDIHLVVSIPVGTIIHINDNLRPIINDRKHSAYKLAGENWMMTEDGLQEAPDIEVFTKPNQEGEGDTGLEDKNLKNSKEEPLTLKNFVLVNTRQLTHMLKGVFTISM